MGFYIYYAVILLVSLANLFCLIYVLVKMYNQKGILHALFGFFCCSLYPFIWGWLNAKQLRIYDIMIFWTVITIFGTLLNVIFFGWGLVPPELMEILPEN